LAPVQPSSFYKIEYIC